MSARITPAPSLSNRTIQDPCEKLTGFGGTITLPHLQYPSLFHNPLFYMGGYSSAIFTDYVRLILQHQLMDALEKKSKKRVYVKITWTDTYKWGLHTEKLLVVFLKLSLRNCSMDSNVIKSPLRLQSPAGCHYTDTQMLLPIMYLSLVLLNMWVSDTLFPVDISPSMVCIVDNCPATYNAQPSHSIWSPWTQQCKDTHKAVTCNRNTVYSHTPTAKISLTQWIYFMHAAAPSPSYPHPAPVSTFCWRLLHAIGQLFLPCGLQCHFCWPQYINQTPHLTSST